MPKTEACEVCGAQANCIGSAKYVCKSCSTFYRRTYSQYGTLKCRRNLNCQIRENERTICRACRLQKCRDVGLRMAGKNLIVQFNGYPERDLAEDDLKELESQKIGNEEYRNNRFTEIAATECSTSQQNDSPPNYSTPQNYTNLPNYSISTPNYYSTSPPKQLSMAEQCQLQSQQMLKAFPDQRYPMLSKVVEAFQQFERRQRFLSAMHQDKEIVEEELTKIVHIIQAKMESSTNRLACMFIMELLADCDLTREQRISILKVSSVQIAMAHKFSLNSCRFFPEPGDTRVCTFIGLYYDLNDLGAFFHGLKLVDKKVIDIIRPICEAGLKATEKARILRPTIIEAIFMMALILFEEIERQLIINESVQKIRDQLYAEFSAYQIGIYGDAVKAGARLIRLTATIYENKTMTVNQEDLYSIADVFLPGFREKYFEYLETGEFDSKEYLHPFPTDEFVSKMTDASLNL